MAVPHPAVRTAFATTGRLVPPLALSLAGAAFNRVGAAAPVRPAEEAVHGAARSGSLVVRGHVVATYAWGTAGAPAVLLVHGWQSRASRFAGLVEDLLGAGLRVVAFDGVAHGGSGGRHTTILDHLAIIRALGDEEGAPFAAVVGHSFGALAAGLALHESAVEAERYVGLAAVSGWDTIIDGFAGQIGLPFSLRDSFSRRVARTVFRDVPDAIERFDLARHPVPPELPTLFVHDERDSQVPLDDAARLHAAHPGSALHVTSGLGHNRLLGDPSVRALVLSHLGRADLAAAS